MTTLYRLYFEDKKKMFPEYESILTSHEGPVSLRRIEGMLKSKTTMDDGSKTTEEGMKALGYRFIIRSAEK